MSRAKKRAIEKKKFIILTPENISGYEPAVGLGSVLVLLLRVFGGVGDGHEEQSCYGQGELHAAELS